MGQKKISVARSFFWKLLERGAAQIITLVVQIVLARILVPDEFGVISILLVFINIANVFIQKGFLPSHYNPSSPHRFVPHSTYVKTAELSEVPNETLFSLC